MGCFGSKDKLSNEDMDFLKSHTRYDEATIKEWYKGFKVSAANLFVQTRNCYPRIINPRLIIAVNPSLYDTVIYTNFN